MSDFNKDNKFKREKGGRGFGGHRDGPRQMHPATCSQCGQSCEVPFKPTGDRPVFCNSCFKKQGGPQPKFAPKNFGGNVGVNAGSAISKAQFDSLNAKVDKILALLAPKMDVPEIKEKKAKTPAKKSKSKKK